MNSIIASFGVKEDGFYNRMRDTLPDNAVVHIIEPSMVSKNTPVRVLSETSWYYDMGFKYFAQKALWGYVDSDFFDCDAMYFCGGNTFELAFILNVSGFLPLVREWANAGGIVIGSSAGGIIQTPSVRIASFADPNWIGIEDMSGIGLVDFEVKPHWQMWKHRIEEFKRYKKACGVNVLYGLEDGQAIWTNDDGVEFYGEVAEV